MSVKSAHRTVQVLEVLRRAGRPMRGVEVAKALGLAMSSANDLLKALVYAGCLTFDPRVKTYLPSLTFASYAHWLASLYPQLSTVFDLMQSLRDESGHSVVLSVYNSTGLRIASVLPGSAAPPPIITPGFVLPLLGTAAGGAVFMTTSASAISTLVSGSLRLRSGRAYDREVKARQADAERFRRKGYANAAHSDLTPGFWPLALPLPCTANSTERLILGLGGPETFVRPQEAQLAALMRERIHSLQ